MNNQFSEDKLYSFSNLIGQTIVSKLINDYFTTNAGVWHIYVSYDSSNSSDAFIESVTGWDDFIDEEIVEVDDPDDHDRGCTVTLKSCSGKTIDITFVHEDNGYYGYSYGLTFVRSK